jgi:hypothetical protein
MADQPTAPWWATFISIILTAIVSVVGTLIFVHRNDFASPTTTPGFYTLATDTITYIPHILLLFGVLADVFTMEGVYSIPSLVGAISIPLNYLFTFFWAGIADTYGMLYELAVKPPGTPLFQRGGRIVDYPGCYVQGFEALQSGYAPQTLVVTATIFSYYMFDLIANRPINDAIATIVFFGVLFFGQSAIIGNCEVEGYVPISIFLKMAMALAEGMFIGGLSYATVQAQYPNRLPSSVLNNSAGGTGSSFNFGGVSVGGVGGNYTFGGVTLPGLGGLGPDGKPVIPGIAGSGCTAVPSKCPAGSVPTDSIATTANSPTANTSVGSTAGSSTGISGTTINNTFVPTGKPATNSAGQKIVYDSQGNAIGISESSNK